MARAGSPRRGGSSCPSRCSGKLFRGKLLSKIERALRAGEILGDLTKDLALLRRTPKTWNVYVKPPLAGPGHVVRYLSRYVHRIAIANSRITDYDGENVTFRYKDRADGNATKYRTVSGPDFARLFLQHVLPPRFVRIRHYGILAATKRAGSRSLSGAARRSAAGAARRRTRPGSRPSSASSDTTRSAVPPARPASSS